MKKKIRKPLSFSNIRSKQLIPFYCQMVSLKNIYRAELELYEEETLNNIIHKDKYYKCICAPAGCNWCPWHNIEERYTKNPSFTCINLRNMRAPIKINDKLSLIAKISYIIKQAKKELQLRGVDVCYLQQK